MLHAATEPRGGSGSYGARYLSVLFPKERYALRRNAKIANPTSPLSMRALRGPANVHEHDPGRKGLLYCFRADSGASQSRYTPGIGIPRQAGVCTSLCNPSRERHALRLAVLRAPARLDFPQFQIQDRAALV